MLVSQDVKNQMGKNHAKTPSLSIKDTLKVEKSLFPKETVTSMETIWFLWRGKKNTSH